MTKITKLEFEPEIDGENRKCMNLSVKENGNLLFEGQDSGPDVQKFFGVEDHEYFIEIPQEYKDTLLLHVLKKSFTPTSALTTWLKENDIPGELSVR